eukprot:jgi/Mesvir1/5640/Mv15658-RA.1
MARQCSRKTLKGTRCRNTAQKGNRSCACHAASQRKAPRRKHRARAGEVNELESLPPDAMKSLVSRLTPAETARLGMTSKRMLASATDAALDNYADQAPVLQNDLQSATDHIDVLRALKDTLPPDEQVKLEFEHLRPANKAWQNARESRYKHNSGLNRMLALRRQGKSISAMDPQMRAMYAVDPRGAYVNDVD